MPRRIGRSFAEFLTRFELGGEGLPLADELIGTILVNDVSNIVPPERQALCWFESSVAAVAGERNIVEVHAGRAPIEILSIRGISAAFAQFVLRAGGTDIVTLVSATNAPSAVLGGVASTAIIHTGSAVAAFVPILWSLASLEILQVEYPILLRPGEYIAAQDGTANHATDISFLWREYPTPVDG